MSQLVIKLLSRKSVYFCISVLWLLWEQIGLLSNTNMVNYPQLLYYIYIYIHIHIIYIRCVYYTLYSQSIYTHVHVVCTIHNIHFGHYVALTDINNKDISDHDLHVRVHAESADTHN